jgi:hypothetical protein
MIIHRAPTQVAWVPGRHAVTGHIHDAGRDLFRVVFRVRRVGGIDQSQPPPKDGYKVRTNRHTHRELEIDLSLAYVTTISTEPGLQGHLCSTSQVDIRQKLLMKSCCERASIQRENSPIQNITDVILRSIMKS